jgi:uncharacterized protein DUF5709
MGGDDRTGGAPDNGAGGLEEWDDIEDDGVLDASDTLDDDLVADPLDTGVVAGDRWTGANSFGTTLAEGEEGESLDQLLAEEEPDVDPYADGTAEDDDRDEDELTRRGYEREGRAGRLVAADEGSGEDEEPDAVARDAGVDAGAATAEEAAVHWVDDPNNPGDRPL